MRIGLALSGGGFRATLYHLGVIRYLRDADLLKNVSHITSVSGGSVLAAHLVLNWEKYSGTAEEFDAAAQELLDFVSLDVRNRIVRRYPSLMGLALGRKLLFRRQTRYATRTGLLESYYQRHLLGDVCLHELPTSPEVHLLCTNVGEGGLCSFMREGLVMQKRNSDGVPELKMHRAGLVKLATAVAASSAFPAFFPPMAVRAEDVGTSEGEFSTQYFTDGGVYDNLGVRMFHYLFHEAERSTGSEDFQDVTSDSRVSEKAQENGGGTAVTTVAEIHDQPKLANRCDLILVSDAGRSFAVHGPERTPGFLATALRSSDILMDRVWHLERQNFAGDQQFEFAAITDVVPLESDPTAMHPEIQAQVSRIRTDLDRFRTLEISGLIRHGYCVARQVCRSVTPSLPVSTTVDGPPWDPTESQSSKKSKSSPDSAGVQGHAVSLVARDLQRGAGRRLWSALFDPNDWLTWFYVPLILLCLVGLPWLAYRTYRHAHLTAALTRAVVETRDDYRQTLELLEDGTPGDLGDLIFEDTPQLASRLAEEGLDIISDSRITDLRAWTDEVPEGRRRVYVYRRVLVRKVAEASSLPGLRLQRLWDSPELSVRCANDRVRPIVRRCDMSPTKDRKGPYVWEVQMDFSDVPIGDTEELIVEIMYQPANTTTATEQEWWHFEIDAQPEVVTSWILLPDDSSAADFSVVRYRNDEPEVIELTKPTHRTKMEEQQVIIWSVVHPEPGYTYSSRWEES